MSLLNPARSKLLETFALDGVMVRGSGARLFDESGGEYLDFLSQYGALPFGHNPERGWAALRAAQTAQLPSLIQPLRSPEAERLARRLAEVTPGDLSITTLANSGAETVEAAIKLARIRTGRAGILSTRNGFHGKTLGALSATGKPLYQQGFNAPAPDFDYVPFGDLPALEARLAASAGSLAAFIFEPIQGEGGIVCPPDGYVEAAIALCRQYGVLTILDEIQTGLGRTGELFACSGFREVPDMLLLSKALGGGLMPIGACIVRPSAWDDRFGRLHSSTFANNALAATVACATLDQLLEDDQALVRQVAENGAYIRARLETLQRTYPDVIREVRGRGYMLGLEFQPLEARQDSAIMAHAGLNGGVTALIASYLVNVQKVLTAPLFNDSRVLRLQPPLILDRAGLDRAVEALAAVCAIIDRGDYFSLVRHLVAQRPAQTPEPEAQAAGGDAAPVPVPADSLTRGRFGFVIHYTEDEDIFRSDPSLRQFDDAELTNWKAWVKGLGPGVVHEIPGVTSRTGEVASGWLLSVPMLPGDMRGKGRNEARQMIADAVGIAGERGACRVGLGAFTSIVTRGGETVTGNGVPITSGNTLTTVAAVQAVTQMCRRTGIALEDAHVVVVGASGAIGRLGALLLARRAGSMTLVGNARNPFAPRLLSKVADEILLSLSEGHQTDAWTPGRLARSIPSSGTGNTIHFPAVAHAQQGSPLLSCTTDLDAALVDADVVLVATSSDTVLVDPRQLRPGTLVCDVARPPNVAQAELRDSGVLVFDGGLVRPPSPVNLGPFQTLPSNAAWGCLSETMLLALSGQERDFSIGSALTLADADLLASLAEEHGFVPASPQWYGSPLTDAAIDSFASHVHAARELTRTRRWKTRAGSEMDHAPRPAPHEVADILNRPRRS